MDKVLKYWWVFPLTFLALLLVGLYFVVHPLYVGWFWAVLSILTLLSAFLQVAAAVAALMRRRYRLMSAICGCGVLCVIVFCLAGWFSPFVAGSADHFGREHPIPPGLACEVPSGRPDPMAVDSTRPATWLQVVRGPQPGMYEYACWAPALPDGIVYLKCFEVTGNIPLSASGIESATMQPVDRHSRFARLPVGAGFTIYEGVWGEPYAVRVEVWFRSAADRSERKLAERVYRMEGWMR